VYTKLKKRREERGLTQVEIAKKAGISWRAYQTYEAGDRIPKADTAKLIAKALDSTVEELF
jgi:DNA-binding XRE family transcriptional regulator